MLFFVKRSAPYSAYLAVHKEGGALHEHLNARVESGSLTAKDRSQWPISESEWVDEYGSLDGPITQTIVFATEEESEKLKLDDSVNIVGELESVTTPDGFSEIAEDAYIKETSPALSVKGVRYGLVRTAF